MNPLDASREELYVAIHGVLAAERDLRLNPYGETERNATYDAAQKALVAAFTEVAGEGITELWFLWPLAEEKYHLLLRDHCNPSYVAFLKVPPVIILGQISFQAAIRADHDMMPEMKAKWLTEPIEE